MIRIEDAKPYAYEFELSTAALMIIDMQNDFCAPGGFGERLGNDIAATSAIIPTIQAVLHAARQLGMLVIHTREGHLPDLSDCPPSKLARSRKQGAGIGDVGPMGRILIRGEQGHHIVPELAPISREIVIDKPGKGAFYNTELSEVLQQHSITHLVVCGVTTHVCVSSTVREANDRDYQCVVLSDATAAFDHKDHEAALRMIHQQGGIFGWVTDTQSFMQSLTATNRD